MVSHDIRNRNSIFQSFCYTISDSNNIDNDKKAEMFWSETLKEGNKFCVCHGSWSRFRIINVDVTDALFELYVTPEDGNRSLLLSLRRGEQQQPSRFSFDLNFKSLQHVKFEVRGGEITIVGESYDSGYRSKNFTRFLPSCPFAGEEDWGREKQIYGYEFERNDDDDYDNLLRKVDLNKVFLLDDETKDDEVTSDIRWIMLNKELERQNKTLAKITALSEDDYDTVLLKADLAKIFEEHPDDDELVKEAKKKVYERMMKRRYEATKRRGADRGENHK